MQIIQLNLSYEEKIGFVSDLHLDSLTPQSRIDDLTKTCLEKVEGILNKCKERNVRALCRIKRLNKKSRIIIEFLYMKS